MKNPKFIFLSALGAMLATQLMGGVAVTSSYTQNFNDIGTALPDGWAVWLDSTATGNGSAFTWSGAEVANNASTSATNYFRNLPGASQAWSAGLSTGTDRALGWRAGSSTSRDGSMTFTFNDTLGWNLTSLSFDLFTPNVSGSAATIQLEYQIGASGTFTQLAGVSYTTNTPLSISSISLTALNLEVISNQSSQVTLRLNNIATSGTTWQSVAIDNFTYSASAVPEPATYPLLAGAAALGFIALRRRRAHQATA